jgi:hypothetical protein
MRAQQQIQTIHSLNAQRAAAESAWREADVLVSTAAVKQRETKRVADCDPCDFTKAAAQAAQQEYDEAFARRLSLKEELRRSSEAVRVFCYKGKTISQNGKLVRR